METDCAGSDTVRGAAQPGGGGGAPQVQRAIRAFIGQKYSNFSFVLSLFRFNEFIKTILTQLHKKVTLYCTFTGAFDDGAR
jgi:hypothetical protein